MAATVNAVGHSTKINSLDGVRKTAARASLRVNTDTTPNNVESTANNSIVSGYTHDLHQAIDVETSRKDAAYQLKVDPAQLSRGAVSISRLENLPLTMQQRFLMLACVRAGLKATKATSTDELVREIRRNIDLLLDLMEQVRA